MANVKAFSVATTNLFPATNTTKGGQLVTEYNLRSRESVMSDESVKYMYGPSYVHSETDYYVSCAAQANISYFPDSVDTSGTSITIHAGRAIVNGYYVENLADMVVDIAEINAERTAQGYAPLSGRLAVGLRIMFSSEQGMVGSIETEDSNDEYYEGIQVVVLPEDSFVLPTSIVIDGGVEYDCGLEENRWRVNADLKLASFSFIGGSVSDVVNNYPAKCQMLPASRIGDIDKIVSSSYVKKTGLNPKKLYTFAGKGTDPETGNSTWCDSTDALMIFDRNPQLTTIAPTENEAIFRVSPTDVDQIQLLLPHKQVDGMTDGQGNPQYYKAKALNIPKADFGKGNSGMVTSSYTKSVKAITTMINNLYQLTNGHQRAFLDSYTGESDSQLPPINPSWDAGDYVLVAKDSTIISELNDSMNLTPPSTIYVVLPGVVTEIGSASDVQPSGAQLAIEVLDLASVDPHDDPVARNDWWDLNSGIYRGVVGSDYFTLRIVAADGTSYTDHYYTVTNTNGLRSYSNPIQLTGQYPFATEEMTGGFLNAPEQYIDAGYVYLDDYGHLRLRDYALLRSGTLAYQLAQDYTVEAGLTIDEIQADLDEYVNQRIAFPNIVQSLNSNPNIISVTITLPAESTEDTNATYELNLYDLDSRFNTAVQVNIYGDATARTIINISDCARIKVNVYHGNPTINLYRSCLYYDATVINRLNEVTDMSLWYMKIADTDPDLVVEGMTVREVAPQSVYDNISADYNVVSAEYWSLDTPNDNHFIIALQSLTFGSNAMVTGCGILIRNNSTANILEGRQIIHDSFVLPQNTGLVYPPAKMNQPIKITGRFISAYTSSSPEGYIVQETDFSISTPSYNASTQDVVSPGEIALLINSYTMSVPNPTDIDVWDTSSFQHFEGTTLL